MGASNAGGVGRNRDSEPMSGLTACVNAATGRCCKRGRRWSTASVSQVMSDTSLVVSGGVDCRRRRRNVYDKKPQRYAKDNRTAHLTARSDTSVAYVTNNKTLLDVLYCRHEASRGLFATAELLKTEYSNNVSILHRFRNITT